MNTPIAPRWVEACTRSVRAHFLAHMQTNTNILGQIFQASARQLAHTQQRLYMRLRHCQLQVFSWHAKLTSGCTGCVDPNGEAGADSVAR